MSVAVVEFEQFSFRPLEYAAPTVIGHSSDDNVVDDEWAVAGAVAAFLGVGVGVVAYICSVCQARSFWSCVSAVKKYFSHRGC